MPCSRTSGPTGNTSYYAVCKIAGQVPTNGGTLFEINRVVQVVTAPTKNDQ